MRINHPTTTENRTLIGRQITHRSHSGKEFYHSIKIPYLVDNVTYRTPSLFFEPVPSRVNRGLVSYRIVAWLTPPDAAWPCPGPFLHVSANHAFSHSGWTRFRGSGQVEKAIAFEKYDLDVADKLMSGNNQWGWTQWPPNLQFSNIFNLLSCPSKRFNP